MYIRGKRSLVPTSKTVFQATEIFKSSVHSVSFLSLFFFLSLFLHFFLSLSFFFFRPILFVLLRKLFAVSCDLFSITIWIFHHFSLKYTIQEQYPSHSKLHVITSNNCSPLLPFFNSRLWMRNPFFLKFLHIIELLFLSPIA